MNGWSVALNLLTPTVLIVFGILLRWTLSSIGGRFDRHEDRIERLEQDSVSKEDWLRETHIGRKRQERMLAELAELKGQNNAALEIGAAIAAMARKDAER